jgi:CheY-like chemotaxis protein
LRRETRRFGQSLDTFLTEKPLLNASKMKRTFVFASRAVTTAMNGKEAIDALLSPTQDVDMILTDIMMPEVDGMELMKIVQASDKPFRSIPIIIMSTVDSDEFKTKCGDAGATDYLVKPVRKQQMEELSRHASFSSAPLSASGGSGASDSTNHAAREGAKSVGDRDSGRNQKSGGSNNSADTAQGARGVSPEEPSSAPETEALGRGKRSGRVADRMAQRAREDAAREAAEKAKAQARASAKRAAKEKEKKGAKAPASGDEGKQGTTGDGRRCDDVRAGAGSGSGCGSGGSGSGAGEDHNVEGLSVQLVKAYGGATTMLELTLPRPRGEEAPKVGLRRSASRSAFQSFLNLEDAAAAQVISLKVDPEVAARAEGALASLAGIAAVAEEGTGRGKTASVHMVAAARAMPGAGRAPPPNLAAFFGVPGLNPGAPAPPHAMGMGMMPGQAHSHDGMPPGMGAAGMFPPCPPGVDPMLYAQHMGAAASAASAAAATAGPVGSAAAASEFVSKFYSVLQSAVEHQQSVFARMGAKGTCAKRRAEAIARYLKKRKDRNFEKKVRYASRKRLAEARPRVRGQFVRLKEGDEEEEEEEEEADASDGKEGSADRNDGKEGSGNDEAGSNGGSDDGGSKENSRSPGRP